MNKESQAKALKKALNYIRSCPYKGKYIKLELEGQLNRNYDDYSIGVSTSWTNDRCSRFLKSHVSKEAKNALVYSKFYRDGSVDSEFTFTLPIMLAHYGIEYIKAFKLLAEKIGNGLDVRGAGMHIAILNSEDGNYPGGNQLSSAHALNFATTMNHFLPALYFLSSCSHNSRALNYRVPKITLGSKYSCISGSHNVFEYRVFETCYEKPEALIDFICVIANTLKFYKAKPVKFDFFNTVGKIKFKQGWGLQKFFFTSKHLEALEKTVNYLKPSYKTFDELKKERSFKIDNNKLIIQDKMLENRYSKDYDRLINKDCSKEKYVEQRKERYAERACDNTVITV
jgi:hypothetical protein